MVYIDEAGDPAIERVRPIDPTGASEWLVLGAVLIRSDQESGPVEWIREMLREIGSKQRPSLHYRDLREPQKRLVCEALATKPVALFALISNKKNMRQHRNLKAEAKANPLRRKQWFYNYCIRLLLERVTDLCLLDSIDRYREPRLLKIVFSKRGGHSYSHTLVYSDLLKSQARAGTTLLRRREVKWQVLNNQLQEVVAHTGNAGLQLADIVASAFFQAVDVLPPTSFNSQNARFLRPRMAREAGFFHDYGVAFQPSPAMTKAMLTPAQKDIFEFYGFDRRDFDIPW